MSRLLRSIHNTAQGLHESGLIAEMTMREFDELCIPPVEELSAEAIKAIRHQAGVSQVVFAHYLNASPSSVQKWERGVRRPDGTALKLLNMIKNKGFEVLA
ncbi:MAG: helix-turn-helix domain-containing protein [Aeromonas sp.]